LEADRLGCDLRHLVNHVHDLTVRGIGFRVLTGHVASIASTSSLLLFVPLAILRGAISRAIMLSAGAENFSRSPPGYC
jgi:hypothetical protein